MLKLAQQTATTNAGAKLDVVAYDFVRGPWGQGLVKQEGLIWEGYDLKTQGMLLRTENCLAASLKPFLYSCGMKCGKDALQLWRRKSLPTIFNSMQGF